MFCNLCVADFEVTVIVYVEIFLFNLVVEFFLLIFDFFFLFELSLCCQCLGCSFSFYLMDFG